MSSKNKPTVTSGSPAKTAASQTVKKIIVNQGGGTGSGGARGGGTGKEKNK